jgi:hypothetical protein
MTNWKFYNLKTGENLEGSIEIDWELDLSSTMSENYTLDNISAHDLFREWSDEVEKKYPNGLIPISWFVQVNGPDLDICEQMPFQFEDTPDEKRGNFLAFYTQPINSVTKTSLKWWAMPVKDKYWSSNQHDKGGFVQQATGWKPSVLDPYIDLHVLIDLVRQPEKIAIMRRSFHEYASELEEISRVFRSAYTDKFNLGEVEYERIMSKASQSGTDLLRSLALSIRIEQDAGLIDEGSIQLGTIVESISDNRVSDILDRLHEFHNMSPNLTSLRSAQRFCEGFLLQDNLYSRNADFLEFKHRKLSDYILGMSGRKLYLRRVLNCIAHADLHKNSFFASRNEHCLIFSGLYRDRQWIALFSLIDLCESIKMLPDNRW